MVDTPTYIIMRKDLSATMADSEGPLMFHNKEAAEEFATNVNGLVVNISSCLISQDPNNPKVTYYSPIRGMLNGTD